MSTFFLQLCLQFWSAPKSMMLLLSVYVMLNIILSIPLCYSQKSNPHDRTVTMLRVNIFLPSGRSFHKIVLSTKCTPFHPYSFYFFFMKCTCRAGFKPNLTNLIKLDPAPQRGPAYTCVSFKLYTILVEKLTLDTKSLLLSSK